MDLGVHIEKAIATIQNLHSSSFTIDRQMHGLRVWVLMGLGMGIDLHTHHLQNEYKNIFFGGELIEIWPIL